MMSALTTSRRSMRSGPKRGGIIVVSGDLSLRARVAQVAICGGYRVQVAESVTYARQIGLDRVGLAIFAMNGTGERNAAAIAELRKEVGSVLVVANGGQLGQEVIDVSNDRHLLDRIADALIEEPPLQVVEPLVEFAGYHLDLADHSLKNPAGKEIPLTRNEFGLLRAFVQRQGRVLSRAQLMQVLAGRDCEVYDRSVDMLVMRLRRKIELDAKRPNFILTLPGSGYRFAVAVNVIGQTTARDQTGAALLQEAPRMSERRYITALAAELVPVDGAELPSDPEDLRALIEAFRRHAAAVLIRHGASISESRGRQIVAYFGFPLEHEHAAERAISAGIALAKSVPETSVEPQCRFMIRVGVSSGLVVAESSGEIVGETPAHAARICELAGRGQIFVAGETRHRVGALFTSRCLPLTGSADRAITCEIYEIVGRSAFASRSEVLFLSQLTPLVGRESELALLTSAWRQAKSGEGRLVLVSGEPGIGKSRLLIGLEEAIADELLIRWHYFCSPLHGDTALHPVIARMEREADFVRGESDEARLRKLEALLEPAHTGPEEFALISAMLSVPTGDRCSVLDLTPRQRKQRTFAALHDRVVRVARQAPVLMLAEDAHWADPSSLELLDGFVQRLSQLPVLLVLSHRPEFKPPWIGLPGVSLISLGRLNGRHSAALAAQVSGGRFLGRALQTRIVEQADGVPLLIEELTKSVLDLPTDEIGNHPTIPIPSTLSAAMMARLDRLPIAKQVAQVGAVVGREFSPALLAAAAFPLSAAQIQQGLDELLNSGLIGRHGTPPDYVFFFKHALIQDAAYSTLLREHRRDLHGKIAEALGKQLPSIVETEPEVLARHFAEAGLREEAARLWATAGKRSLARSAPIEAVAQLKRALALIEGLPETKELRREAISLQTALMTTLYLVKGYAATEAKAALECARALLARAESLGEPSENPLALFAILTGLWTTNYIAFNGDAQVEFASQLLLLAEKQENVDVTITGYLNMGVTMSAMGSLDKADRYFDQAFALFPRANSHTLIALTGFDYRHPALASSAIRLWLSGYPATALSHCEKAIGCARTTGHVGTLLMTMTTALIVQILSGRYLAAIATADEIEASSNEKELAFFLWPAKMARGAVAALEGNASAAVEIIISADQIARQTGTTLWAPRKKTLLAGAYARLGQFDLARACISEALEAVVRTKETWFEAEIHRVAGEIELASPERNAAESQKRFERALYVARVQNARSLELRAATSLARLWRENGALLEARELLGSIYGWFTEGFETQDLKEAKALLTELAI